VTLADVERDADLEGCDATMSEPQPHAEVSRRAIVGFVLICLALPITFAPATWAVLHDQGTSAYRVTTLLGIPLGIAGLVLCLLALVDIPQSEGRLRGRALATAGLVLGALGAAAATPLILGALFGP
jgi:hypothetical protein